MKHVVLVLTTEVLSGIFKGGGGATVPPFGLIVIFF